MLQARLLRCLSAGVMLALTLTAGCKLGSGSNLATDASADRCADKRQRVTNLERELAQLGTGGSTAATGSMEQKCATAKGKMNGEYCVCEDGMTLDLDKGDVCAGGTRMEGWLASSRNGDKALCDTAGGTFEFADGACVCPGSAQKYYGSYNIRTFCGKEGGGSTAAADTDYMAQCTAAGLVWADGSKDDGCRCPDNSSTVRHPYASNKDVCRTSDTSTPEPSCDSNHPGWRNDSMDCVCGDGSVIDEFSSCPTGLSLTGGSAPIADLTVPDPGFALTESASTTRDRATVERELATAREELRVCTSSTAASGNVSCAVVEKATGTVQATCFDSKPESQCRSEFQTVYENVSPGKYELKVYPGVSCDEARRRAGGTGGTSSTASASKIQAFETACRSQGGESRPDSGVSGGHRCICPSTGGMQAIGGWTEGSSTVFQSCPRVDFANPSAAQLAEFRTQCTSASGTVNQVGGYNCVCPSGTNSLQNWMTAGGMGDPDYMRSWCSSGGTSGGGAAATDRETQFRTACTAGNARIVPNSSPTLCECLGGDRSSTSISVWESVGKTANYYVSRCGPRTATGTSTSAASTAQRPPRSPGNYCPRQTFRATTGQVICGVINCTTTLCRYSTAVLASQYQNNCANYCSRVQPTLPAW